MNHLIDTHFTVMNFNFICRLLSMSICHFLSKGIAIAVLSGWCLSYGGPPSCDLILQFIELRYPIRYKMLAGLCPVQKMGK